MPEEYVEQFKKYPGSVRIQLYKQFDKEVHALWSDLLKTANEKAKESGVEMTKTKTGYKVFDKDHCVDTDEVLINAAQLFVTKFINENPLAGA